MTLLFLYLVWPSVSNGTVDYPDVGEHFKYGSIGSEPANGIPYWIWKALPELFADKLPGKGYASLGFIQEEGQDRPIGFSSRRVFIERVSFNCGVCHTGTLRDEPGGTPRIILGMPANTMDLEGYTRFLLECARDERFTADLLMEAIEKVGGHLGFVERYIYRHYAIPQTKAGLLARAAKLTFLARQPDWGPGRVDTFNPYKALQFNFPMDKLPDEEIIGIVDLPSIWLQRQREGMQLHWDGDNSSVEERNKSAALGAGVTPVTIDLPRIKRIEDWLLDFSPPPYPYAIDRVRAERGKPIYRQYCADCHGENGRHFTGKYIGQVVSVEEVGTDRHRLDSYTYELLSNQNTLYAGYPWRFSKFRKTNGYANMPLDGIWLRAPYLHNGSVPTLRDLLKLPEDRPQSFYRGNDVFDRDNVGFASTVAEIAGRRFFRYDSSLPGNSSGGHLYGTTLQDAEKDALIEYLKTF
jgi:mono/diheme cytochrome c family protein